MRLFSAMLALALSMIVVAGCDNRPVPKKPQAAQVAPAAKPTPTPGAATGAATAPSTPGVTRGVVVETMDASSYTYVLLKTPSGGKIWAAGPQTAVKVGQEIEARGAMVMNGFHSDTLNRDFDQILFAEALASPASPGTAAATGMPKGHPAMGGAAGGTVGGAAGSGAAHTTAKKAAVQAVAKADGADGRTVAEIYAGKATLSGKPVAVRGIVVRWSPGIMGRNWLHLQDTTGDPQARTHDLTVTTTDTAKLGDTVLVKGTIAVDKDFGAGYRYAVIVEQAKVTVE